MKEDLDASDWRIGLRNLNVLPGFPQGISVAVETQTNAAYHWSGKTRRDRNHCLFKYTLSGEGVFRCKSSEYRMTAGHGFPCETRDPSVAYYFPAGQRTPWRFLYVCFIGDMAFTAVQAILARYPPEFRLSPRAPVIRRLLNMGMEIRQPEPDLFSSSFCEEQGAPPRPVGKRDITQTESLSLFAHLLASLLSEHEQSETKAPAVRLTQRAMNLMDQHLSDGMNVAELAQALDVSREHLTRVFRAQTGQSPHEYLLRQKLSAAGEMMRASNCSIKEISTRLGFYSAAHFSRVFRQELGMTPTEFREKGGTPLL
jgi:AraC-like DNA-binding protein